MTKLKEKYNLLTATSCIIGIVIGTGIFFKTGTVLKETNGNFWLSILAWFIGGSIMVLCSYNFATISLHNKDINNLNDFGRVTVGNKYAHYIGAFAKNIYFPSMTATVSFVAGMYTCELFNLKDATFPFSWHVFLFAGVYLVLLFLLNILAPIISGKFQVSTTFIKMIPLLIMAIVGMIAGLSNGLIVENTNLDNIKDYGGKGLFAAICVTSFSYEGWICATNIGEEIKNKHKNLPKALILGTTIVMIIYIFYNIGILGVIKSEDLITGSSSELVNMAFTKLLGNFASVILNVIIVISALGTLNGLTMANSRASYTLARYDKGIAPNLFNKINDKTNMPINSAIFGLVMAVIWLIYYYFSQTNELANGIGFPFSSDELPIITTYMIYIPIFISLIFNKNLKKVNRFIAPILGIISAIIMIAAAIYRHGINTIWYLIFFFIFLIITTIIFKFNRKKESSN